MSQTHREDTRMRFPGRRRVRFRPARLGEVLQERVPEVDFAYLLGSAVDGVVAPYSDVDVAAFFRPTVKVNWDLLSATISVVEEAVSGEVEADVSTLNNAHVVFRFEALRGRNLFVRPEATERYVDFYTRTCREYDQYILEMERNRRLRAETTTTK